MSTKIKILPLVGKYITNIEFVKIYENDAILFHTSDNIIYSLWHEQEYSEIVSMKDVVGNIGVILNTPILMAEEIIEHDPDAELNDDNYASETWSYYKFATVNGYVTISWYGKSNGCYTETAEFEILDDEMKEEIRRE
jgi:hypothetical protein